MNIKVLIFLETWVQPYLFFWQRWIAYLPYLFPPFLALVLLLFPPSPLLQALDHFLSGLADPLSLVLESVCVWGGLLELSPAADGRGVCRSPESMGFYGAGQRGVGVSEPGFESQPHSCEFLGS